MNDEDLQENQNFTVFKLSFDEIGLLGKLDSRSI